MDTIWLIIDEAGIDYVVSDDEVVGIYSSKELAEKALSEYEQSPEYLDIDRHSDWHIANIVKYPVNKNLWIEK